MGFDADIARLALRKHYGCMEEAVADLVNNQGIISVHPGIPDLIIIIVISIVRTLSFF